MVNRPEGESRSWSESLTQDDLDGIAIFRGSFGKDWVSLSFNEQLGIMSLFNQMDRMYKDFRDGPTGVFKHLEKSREICIESISFLNRCATNRFPYVMGAVELLGTRIREKAPKISRLQVLGGQGSSFADPAGKIVRPLTMGPAAAWFLGGIDILQEIHQKMLEEGKISEVSQKKLQEFAQAYSMLAARQNSDGKLQDFIDNTEGFEEYIGGLPGWLE